MTSHLVKTGTNLGLDLPADDARVVSLKAAADKAKEEYRSKMREVCSITGKLGWVDGVNQEMDLQEAYDRIKELEAEVETANHQYRQVSAGIDPDSDLLMSDLKDWHTKHMEMLRELVSLEQRLARPSEDCPGPRVMWWDLPKHHCQGCVDAPRSYDEVRYQFIFEQRYAAYRKGLHD